MGYIEEPLTNITKQVDVVEEKSKEKPFKAKIVWQNVFGFILLHLGFLIGFWMMITGQAKLLTVVWMVLSANAAGVSTTMGAHRLWTHRSFKAKLPLKLILLIGQTMSGQNCLWVWVRDHRQHHKYSDTDGDPHNSKRGFFFCHIGWLMVRKHPEVFAKGKTIDMSDIEADPWIMFQKKYYKTLYFIFAFAIPILIPVYFWNEDPWVSTFVSYFVRYVLQLHGTWAVNSVAHLYGTRPYDNQIQPVESSFVSFIGLGEGWHNYHHAFPWDCSASEYGKHYNITSTLLRFFERMGLAYDLKYVPKETMVRRILKRGDGTHPIYGTNPTY